MAGSYQHCRNDDGEFSFALIENMRDAYEACEMMFHMIGTLATDIPGGSMNARIKAAEHAYFKSINPSFKPSDDINYPDEATSRVKRDEAPSEKPRPLPTDWMPTMYLRFVKRWMDIHGKGQTQRQERFILQQGYTHESGDRIWVDVPTVEE